MVLALLAAPAGQADERVLRINECNSEITITQTPATATVGVPATVTLTVCSNDSRDNMDMPVAQVFDKASYTGDCQVPPGLPCTAMSPARAMYGGNLGGTCNGMGGTVVTANPMGDSVVEFDFVPDLSLLIPAPATPACCTVTFEVTYAEADDYASQASTAGICQNPGFPPGSVNSDTTVTTVIPVIPEVPTLGEIAVAVLALALLSVAWLVLRRKRAASGI